MIAEGEFRKRIQTTFDRIERAFEGIDPDVAECEQSLGSLTITLADRARCILSTQPSVRQLWLALAARGTAYHFNLTEDRWIDDKGQGIELIAFLEKVLGEATGLPIRIGE
jgi:iron donor protein CyaY